MRRVKLKTSINSWAASPLTAIDLLYLHYAELKERDVTFVPQFEVIAHFYWLLSSTEAGNWLPFSPLHMQIQLYQTSE